MAAVAAGAVAAALLASPAAAKPAKTVAGSTGADALAGSAQAAPNTTVKLIEILIQNGVLTRAQAQALLKQAEEEAAAAARQAPAAGAAGAAGAAAGASAGAGAGAGTGAAGAAPSSVIAAPGAAPGTVRVPYVPETVRRQIKEEVKQEVVQQAKDEGWAQPNTVPDWVNRIRLSGDFRGRFERDLQDSSNFDAVPDVAAINDDGNGYVQFSDDAISFPALNTDQDRTRYRLRARIGVDAEIDDWVSAGFRIATGSDNSPVSTNQTLGSNGNFSKYQIWLDRAFLQLTPDDWVTGYVGRMPNPFWSTDLLFDTDLNFDGGAVQLSHPWDKQTDLFFNAGAFPVFNTAFDFSDFSDGDAEAAQSRDRYLFAGQVGATHRIDPEYKMRGALGFYYFDNLQGKSGTCAAPQNSQGLGACSSDDSIALQSQKGNSYFGVRNIQFDPGQDEAVNFLGLGAEFGVLDLYSRLDVATYDPIHIALEANYLQNVLFDHGDINSKVPVTNLSGGNDGEWEGGDKGFLVRMTVGDEKIDELWDWNVSLAYKYLESDAVPDAFTDSDFHLGGTNAKGYILGGNLGVARNTSLSMRWLSAQEVSGPPLNIDVFQLDLNASF